jgi:hypothetical protein
MRPSHPKPADIAPQPPTTHERRPCLAPPTSPTRGAPELTHHRDAAPAATEAPLPTPPPHGAIPAPRHPPTPPDTHHPRPDVPEEGGHAQREPTGAQRGPHPHPGEDDAARAWGQAQAAAAPRWSAAKRARMARSLGLTLPEDTPR